MLIVDFCKNENKIVDGPDGVIIYLHKDGTTNISYPKRYILEGKLEIKPYTCPSDPVKESEKYNMEITDHLEQQEDTAIKDDRDKLKKENDTLLCSKCGDMLLTVEQHFEAGKTQGGLEAWDNASVEIKRLKEEVKRLRDLIQRVYKAHNCIDWSYDGDCGSSRLMDEMIFEMGD